MRNTAIGNAHDMRALGDNHEIESYDEGSGRLVLRPKVGCTIRKMADDACAYFATDVDRLAEIGIVKLESVDFSFNWHDISVTAEDATPDVVVGMWKRKVEESRERDRRALAAAAERYGKEFPRRVERMCEENGDIVTSLRRVSPNEIEVDVLEAGYVPCRRSFWLEADGSIS